MLNHLALGRGSVDRLHDRRDDAAWFATVVADAATRVIGVCAGDVLVEGTALGDARPRLDDATETVLLGNAAGVTYVAACFDAAHEGFRSLREVGALLSDDDAALATMAVALHQWHRTHTRCPRCGEATRAARSGWERHCTADGTSHFPRTDPAVIVAIVDHEDRLLLARQTVWPERRYSIIAGYVEPGETAEHAVAREALEEVGVLLGDVEYLGSQPWPFPASLMLCYRANARTTDIRVDGEEIAEAAWFSRAALTAAVEAGEVLLPSAVSIARRAIEAWFGGPLPS